MIANYFTESVEDHLHDNLLTDQIGKLHLHHYINDFKCCKLRTSSSYQARSPSSSMNLCWICVPISNFGLYKISLKGSGAASMSVHGQLFSKVSRFQLFSAFWKVKNSFIREWLFEHCLPKANLCFQASFLFLLTS